MTDQELKDLVASLAVQSAKTDAAMATLAITQARTEKEVDKTTRTIAEMGRRMDEMGHRMDEVGHRTDAVIRRMDEMGHRTDAVIRRMDEVGRRMGAMASNQGDVAEEFFYNSLKHKPQVGDITFDTITPNLVIGTKRSSSEFDIVMVNGKSVALLEVKYKAHINDLDQLEKQISRYRKLRPEHKDYQIYGGIAGFSVPSEVARKAQERGMFVLQRKGEVMASATQGMRPR